MKRNDPAGSLFPLVSSNLSPRPRLIVPEITVVCSMFGCQCGGILYPAGNESRIVIGPSFAGSPSKTANFAPGGSDAGPSFHWMAPGVKMPWSAGALCWLCAATAARSTSQQRIISAAAKLTFFLIFDSSRTGMQCPDAMTTHPVCQGQIEHGSSEKPGETLVSWCRDSKNT